MLSLKTSPTVVTRLAAFLSGLMAAYSSFRHFHTDCRWKSLASSTASRFRVFVDPRFVSKRTAQSGAGVLVHPPQFGFLREPWPTQRLFAEGVNTAPEL